MRLNRAIKTEVGSAVLCLVSAALFFVGFLVLAFALHHVQVSRSASYGYASARQSIRRVQTDGARGRILDRHGEVLAENRLQRVLVCLPESFQQKSWDGTARAISNAVESLAHALGRKNPLMDQAIRRHVSRSLALPLLVWSDLNAREMAVFAENEADHPGFKIEERLVRAYPKGSLAAHLLGYVGRARGEAEAGDEKFSFFQPEMSGRAGLELYYNSFLRGVPGEKKVLVDARGFAIREWNVVEAQKGPDLTLAIDARVQAAAERVLAGEKGACVVLDPRTGEVLALASAPTFDPNDFVPILTHETYAREANDPKKPLLNRASGGAYAPGSTFKPITALAGLSVGFPPDETYDCTGVFDFGSLHLRCSTRWGHGPVDMRHALMKSCNPYFCNVAMDIGTNDLIRTARLFGLGAKTGIDFGVDRAGVVPDAAWKKRTYGERWYAGDLAQMAIGQGMLLVSPLQMARVAGAIATGFLVTPRLKADLPVERCPLAIPEKDLAIVREGMRLVVAGDGESRGTGFRAGQGVPVPVSGKTGTAEVGHGASRRKNVWFIAYAPSENPTVALALVIENGESGGGTAAPKAAEVLKAVFEKP